MNTQIQPSTGMSSADYAAAKDGLLYGERDDAIRGLSYSTAGIDDHRFR